MSEWSNWYTVRLCIKCGNRVSLYDSLDTCPHCGWYETFGYRIKTGQRHRRITPWWKFWDRRYEYQRGRPHE